MSRPVRLAPVDARPVAHLAGAFLTAQGQFHRQRCAWCGVAIIDDDLALMAVAPGSDPAPKGWTPGHWIEITPGNPTAFVDIGPADRMPENSCMAAEVDAVTSIQRGHWSGRPRS